MEEENERAGIVKSREFKETCPSTTIIKCCKGYCIRSQTSTKEEASLT